MEVEVNESKCSRMNERRLKVAPESYSCRIHTFLFNRHLLSLSMYLPMYSVVVGGLVLPKYVLES